MHLYRNGGVGADGGADQGAHDRGLGGHPQEFGAATARTRLCAELSLLTNEDGTKVRQDGAGERLARSGQDEAIFVL